MFGFYLIAMIRRGPVKHRPPTLGFTIIELLVVMVVVGILTVVGMPAAINFIDDARDQTTVSRLQTLVEAITGDPDMVANGRNTKPGFEADIGAVPTAIGDLAAQGAYTAYDPFTKLGWRGPYINSNNANWNRDGFGTLFVYSSGARTLTSCGRDGTCGNADDVQISF